MIDRSKFKPTTASQLVQDDKQLNKDLGKKEKTGNGHEIDEGLNLFRIYPAHPDGGGSSFVEPFAQTFIMARVQERKDGQPVLENGEPKMKIGVKPVYNAVVHGGKPKDLIAEYITLMQKKAKSLGLDKAQYTKYMIPVYGSFNGSDPKSSIMGINYKAQWIVYADKYPGGNPSAKPVFDEWRIGKSVKERLNKISAIESASDPLGTDPFTDVEEGRAVKVIKDSEASTPANFYTTELDNSTVSEVIGNRTVKVQKTYPLSDAQLEHFLKQEPLVKKYGKNLATRKNFETQLAGLEMLDEKYSMGIFGTEEWYNIIVEIDGYYPEFESTAPDNTKSTTEEEPEETPTSTEGDEFDLMERKELQLYAKEYKTGILVKPTMNDNDIREALRTWKKTSTITHIPLPGDTDYVEPEQETKPEPVKDELKPSVAMSAKDKLAALRNKQQAQPVNDGLPF